jgi:hypothetical protein
MMCDVSSMVVFVENLLNVVLVLFQHFFELLLTIFMAPMIWYDETFHVPFSQNFCT